MNTVYVPRDTASISVGSDQVAAKFEAAGFKVIRNGSRGAAWLEPLVEIDTKDGRVGFSRVKACDVDELINTAFQNKNPDLMGVGFIKNIEYFKKQKRHIFAKSGEIDPLSIDDYVAHNGFVGLKKCIEIGSQASVTQVLDSGLRGRGGAAFPTGIKWQTTLNVKSDQKYVVCNADEGDGGTFSDRLVMETDPMSLIEGMIICGVSIGATKGYIYLRSEYPLTKEILGQAIANAYQAGWLGKNIASLGIDFELELRIGAGAYICGEETSLLDSLEGKRGMVRVKPPLPAIEGLFGKPTIINNVITLASVPDILANGAKAYATLGVGRSTGTLPFQLGGNIKRGGLVEVEFGHTLRDILDNFGGGTLSGRPIKAVQLGGPLGSYIHPDEFDTVLDYEKFAEIGGSVGHGGIVVFDDTVDITGLARFAFTFCEVESCGKCTPCRIGAVRGGELLDKIIIGDSTKENFELLDNLFDVMEQGSLCAMGGLTPKPVRSLLKHFPSEFGLNEGVKT